MLIQLTVNAQSYPKRMLIKIWLHDHIRIQWVKTLRYKLMAIAPHLSDALRLIFPLDA